MKKFFLLFLPLVVLFFSCKKNNDNKPALEFSISQSAVSAMNTAYKDTIHVNANLAWSISVPDSANWLSVSPKEGSGNADIYFSLAENNNDQKRSTEVKVITEIGSKKISVVQAGNKSLDLSKNEIDSSYQAFTDSFDVVTVSDWEIETPNDADWISLSATNGSGVETVKIEADANNTANERTITLKIKTAYKSLDLKITQSGNAQIASIDTNGPIDIETNTGEVLNLMAGGTNSSDVMYLKEGNKSIDFPANQSFSISLQVTTSGSPTSQPRILYWSDGTAYLELIIDKNDHANQLGWVLVDQSGTTLRDGPLGNSGDPVSEVTDTKIVDGETHHVALVYDADKNESYISIDGKKEAVVSSMPSFGGISIKKDFLVGDFTKSGATWNFSGVVDNLEFWSKALTKKEVYADAAGITLASDQNNLIAGWDFEDKNGDEVPDVTGSFTGVLYNGAEISDKPQFPKKPITDDNSSYQLITDKMLFPHGTEDGQEVWYYCPALVTLPNGDILMATDQRIGAEGDVGGNPNINLVVRKSTDNGDTWSDMTVLKADGGTIGISDPSLIYDEKTEEVFIFGAAVKNGAHRLYMAKSTDGGDTWSNLKDRPDVYNGTNLGPGFTFIASGRGLYTRDGEMMQMLDIVGPNNYLVVSNDDGASWHIQRDESGNVHAFSPADETKIVELNNGNLMVNARATGGYRHVFESSDGGQTWTDWQESQLPDPYCNAGIIAYTQKQDGFNKNRLLFSNCATSSGRTHMTVKISYDGGHTWNGGRLIEEGDAGYSSMTILKDGTIALAYNTGDQGIRFARFDLEYLTNGNDQLNHSNF